MTNHSCVIGVLSHTDYTKLCTVTDLKNHIAENIEFNNMLDDDPIFRECKRLRRKVWTLKEYADGRRHTDLHRFNYCPECGKRIDWAALKGE